MSTEIEPPKSQADSDRSMLRCLRCKNIGLMQSGREPYRHICERCGANYHIVMQLVPVPAETREAQLETEAGAERCSRTD